MHLVTKSQQEHAYPRKTAFFALNAGAHERIGLWYLLMAIALLLFFASVARP